MMAFLLVLPSWLQEAKQERAESVEEIGRKILLQLGFNKMKGCKRPNKCQFDHPQQFHDVLLQERGGKYPMVFCK